MLPKRNETFLSMAEIEENVKKKINPSKCEYINGHFYPCNLTAHAFNFGDEYPFDKIPEIMRDLKADVCPHCGFRFRQEKKQEDDLWLIPGWCYKVIHANINESILCFMHKKENKYWFCDYNGISYFIFQNELNGQFFPFNTPWSHVPDNCTALKIYPDGSWKSIGGPEFRGIWKECPQQLRPAAGEEFVIRYKPDWM